MSGAANWLNLLLLGSKYLAYSLDISGLDLEWGLGGVKGIEGCMCVQ